MKKMAHLYLLIIASGSSFAMNQENLMHERSAAQEPICKDGKLTFVKKRPGYVYQQPENKKATFMGLIKWMLPKQKEKFDNTCDIKHTMKQKMKKSSKSSVPGLFDLQPIDTEEMTMLTNEEEVRYDYFMKEVEGRN